MAENRFRVIRNSITPNAPIPRPVVTSSNDSGVERKDPSSVAASDPTMWRDVFLNNKQATLEILGRFTEELFALQRAIRLGDGQHLQDYFTRTRAIRRGIIEAGQDLAGLDRVTLGRR